MVLNCGAMNTTIPTDLVPTGEATRIGRVSHETLRKWLKAGVIHAYGKGPSRGRPSRLFSASEVERVARERGLLPPLPAEPADDSQLDLFREAS